MTLDVTKAIEARSDQLNADDLVEPRTIKITKVTVKDGDQPISVFYEGDNGKPWKPSKTGSRCLAYVWGSNASNWIGLSCTIYRDPDITWGGAKVGGVMPSHMEGLEKPVTLMLAKTRGKKAPIVLKPLIVGTNKAHEPQAPVDTQSAQDSARDAANLGRDAFNKWWKDNPDLREEVRSIIEELKQTVEERESLNHAE